MYTTLVIAFREFLEAFLVVGIFLGASKKLHLKKEREILLASAFGMVLSFVLAVGAFFLDDKARNILNEKNADRLEGYLLIFSALFIGYIVLSLHKTLGKLSRGIINEAQQKMKEQVFDLSLFMTIVFMIMREGFEIALFTAGVSLFSVFFQNIIGLFLGFLLSIFTGILVFWAFIKLPVGKVFKITEYFIVLLGASMMQNGITYFFRTNFAVNLAKILPFPLGFLPSEDTMFGNLLQGIFGIDRQFSGIRLCVMVAYISAVYVFYLRQRRRVTAEAPA